MLILARQRGDTVTITTPEGRVITVTVIDFRTQQSGKSVRLGFTADRDVTIVRDDAKSREPKVS